MKMPGVKSTIKSWANKIAADYDRVEEVVAGTILTRSTMIAPRLTGALQSDGRVEKNELGGRTVKFGDKDVPYARRRHFENKKNPQTLNYLKRGGDSVAKESLKKYKDISAV